MVAPRMHAHCARLLGTQFVVHPSTRAAHSAAAAAVAAAARSTMPLRPEQTVGAGAAAAYFGLLGLGISYGLAR